MGPEVTRSVARLLDELGRLDLVTGLDVVELAETDTGLEVRTHLGDVVLLPAQRLDRRVLEHARRVDHDPDRPGRGDAGDQVRAGIPVSDVASEQRCLAAAFGEIGDQRITVMAALTIADDLGDAERRIADLQATIEAARASDLSAGSRFAAAGDAVAFSIEEAARRIERIARGLDGARRD